MRSIIFILVSVLFANSASAQSTAEIDKGFLVNLIEENLSNTSRQVLISGFEGALSSEAKIASLTIADKQGVWLTLQDAALIWNRAALFRGRIEIEQLTAGRIILARAPVSDAVVTPAPEATPFSLPDLPVSVQIAQFSIAELVLGKSFLGQEEQFTLQGNATLADGQGDARLYAARRGEDQGEFTIGTAYDNQSRRLALDLEFIEAANGIAANMLGLPGAPSIDLRIKGDAPLNDFAATLTLATQDQDRLKGVMRLRETAEGTITDVDLRGDIAPLFAPDYQSFFGPDTAFTAQINTPDQGGMSLRNLDLTTNALQLQGAADFDTNGWPLRLQLSGEIANPNGDPVLLPLAGAKTFVDHVTLQLGFDAAQSDGWNADFVIKDLSQPGLAIADLELAGKGQIIPGQTDVIGSFTGDFDFAGNGLEFNDVDTANAIGDMFTGRISANFTQGAPLEFTQIVASGAGIRADGSATIRMGSDLRIAADLGINAEDLSRFSTLLDREINGSVQLDLQGSAEPLSGAFEITTNGTSENLALGITQLDPLLAGAGQITIDAIRDFSGTRLDAFQIITPAVLIAATADLSSDESKAAGNALVKDVSIIDPRITGQMSMEFDVAQAPQSPIDANLSLNLADTSVTLTAQGNPSPDGFTINFESSATVPNVAQFAEISGKPLSGAVEFTANGAVLSDGTRFDANIKTSTLDLVTGIAPIDRMLAGAGTLSSRVARTGEETYSLSDLSLTTPAISLVGDISGALTGAGAGQIAVKIPEAAKLEPGMRGPVSADITVERSAELLTRLNAQLFGSGADIDANLQIASPEAGNVISGNLHANVADLRPIGAIAGVTLRGGFTGEVSGSLSPTFDEFDVTLDAKTQNIGIGSPSVDTLLAGDGRIDLTARLSKGKLNVPRFEAATDSISMRATIEGNEGGGQARFDARLRDLSQLTDQISGPLTTSGTAKMDTTGTWKIDATADGPGGLRAQTQGTITQSAQLNLEINGEAPLALANKALAPRNLTGTSRFNLTVIGPPKIESVSGAIGISSARLSAPNLRQTLTDLNGSLDLSQGQVNVDMEGKLQEGGKIALNGPVALTGDLEADVKVTLTEIALNDPELYQTTVSGAVSAKGPLAQRALISGNLVLGETNLRVPSSGFGSLGELPDVTHVGAPTSVTTTLERAGLLKKRQANVEQDGAVFDLNVAVSAPSRIFIRGRGLDAELGGALRIGGTTAQVVPTGDFGLVRGRLEILQQRFDLTEGSASLQGDFIPTIRLVAQTETPTGTTVQVIVEGPATEPEIRFESSPELPQDEVLAQLIFGRELENISPFQAVQLAAAVGTLTGRGGAGFVDNFRQNIGLDDLDITTDEAGNAAVRAGKYVTENVYTDVTVSSDGSTDIHINLDLSNTVTAKGSVGADGETSIGIFFEKDY